MTHTHALARLRVPHLSPSVELQGSLASRVEDISPFVDGFTKFLKPLVDEFRKGDGSDVEIEIAVREAIANAVIHGNHEDPWKRVYVTCRCSTEGEVLITVRDEGKGFDNRAVLDPTDETNLLRTHGRGLLLMQSLMDEVGFQENGTVVRMRKFLRRPNSSSLDVGCLDCLG